MVIRLVYVLFFMFLGSLMYYRSFIEAWESFLQPWYIWWPVAIVAAYLTGKVFPETTYWGRQAAILRNAEEKLKEDGVIDDE